MPPVIKTKRELATEAVTFASSYNIVFYDGNLYMPVDFETGDTSSPVPERTTWNPLTRTDLQRWAHAQFNTLFETDAMLSSFYYMVVQVSTQHLSKSKSLLVKTAQGLQELKEDGELHEPSGEFIPNTLNYPLNTNQSDKDYVFQTLTNWLNSEEEATAALRHFATALAPGWSAIRYVLLLGGGRNGKSLLLSMMQELFGKNNSSSITRQDIADKSPIVTELNGKLLNLVFDGPATYLKDSGHEKTLIAGETIQIRRLYSSDSTPVQTNALFVEGLNREPKTSDKSTALQSRIIRFYFPNSYDDDTAFWNSMTSPRYVGALLALLIDNYVKPHEASVMLAPSQMALALQMSFMYENSLGLQFLKHFDEQDPFGAGTLLGMDFAEITAKYQSWRIQENDLRSWPEPDVLSMFQPLLDLERKSRRINGKPRKVKVVVGFRKIAAQFLEQLREEEVHDPSNDSVVED